MAMKVFIEREIWGKKWFRALETHERLFFLFLISTCDHGGIWDVDLDLAQLRVGQKLDLDALQVKLAKQIEVINPEKWWVKKFISIQYGALSPNWSFHKPACKVLKKYGLLDWFVENDDGKLEFLAIIKPTASLSLALHEPCSTHSLALPESCASHNQYIPEASASLLDMDMDKDMDKDKDRIRDKITYARGQPEIPEWALDVQLAWNRWRLGNGLGADPTGSVKGQGMKNLLKLAKKPESLSPESLARCAERYLITVTDSAFVCHFANFWGRARRFEPFLANDWAPSEKTMAEIAHAEMLAARQGGITMDDCDDDFN